MPTIWNPERWGEFALPLVLLLLPILLSVVVGEVLLFAFPVALLIGLVLAPPRLWPLWLGSIVLVWGVYGVAVLVGALPGPGEPDSGGETVWSFMIETVIFMAALVLLPLWLGRMARRLVGRYRHRPTTL